MWSEVGDQSWFSPSIAWQENKIVVDNKYWNIASCLHKTYCSGQIKLQQWATKTNNDVQILWDFHVHFQLSTQKYLSGRKYGKHFRKVEDKYSFLR